MQYQKIGRSLVGLALVIGSLVLGGCASVMESLKDVVEQRPTADVTAVKLIDIGLRSATLEFEVALENPYSFDLPLLDFDFDLSTRGNDFLKGAGEIAGSIPAHDSKLISLPVQVDFVTLIKTVSSIRPGQVVPYDAELGLRVDLVGSGPLRLPLRKSGELPIPSPPSVKVQSFDWDHLSLDEARGQLVVAVQNNNEFPFAMNSMGYGVSIANSSVARGENKSRLELDPGQEDGLAIPISISPTSAGIALFKLLTGEEIEYSIAGELVIDTAFGQMSLPFDQSGMAANNR